MKEGARLAWQAVLFPGLLTLMGCGSLNRFESLDNRHQRPELPAYLNVDNREGSRVSLQVAGNNQERIRWSETFRMQGDSSGRVLYGMLTQRASREWEIEEKVSIRRDPVSVSAHYLKQGREVFRGFSVGFSPTHPGLAHAGAFLGLSRAFGRGTPGMTAGVFYNRMDNGRSRFWSHSPSHTDLEETYFRDSASAKADWILAMKFAFAWEVAPRWHPYVTVSGSTAELWPAETKRGADFSVHVVETGAGLLFRLAGGNLIDVEADYADLGVGDRYGSYHFTVKAACLINLPQQSRRRRAR
jgi:hypothetical protein